MIPRYTPLYPAIADMEACGWTVTHTGDKVIARKGDMFKREAHVLDGAYVSRFWVKDCDK